MELQTLQQVIPAQQGQLARNCAWVILRFVFKYLASTACYGMNDYADETPTRREFQLSVTVKGESGE
jgi:hypothetical protein